MTATFELTLKNDMAEHARLSAALADWAEAQGIDAGLVTTFELAFDEILANITSYAYDDGGEHAIEVTCHWDGSALSAEVVDDGRAFDPLAAPDPDLEAGLDEREIGGLGLFMVRQLMDDVAYRREDGRNRLSFAKKQDAA
ncbi:serine/threonine-protein kinase RsbW [Tistlia consotensis]|uniref:Serine/threonine-protein kinase RsbW/sigma-B regulation protein RsbU (Phosphoserine phosphatase) n=1 Tax=Tistlia consotensis USBA 355 TaxID=560819 RepID=A0A1Y6CW21_9PROT|nr:ATP-binding protein [Tistlia consotensis]SMF81221.1 serine/threonine-protein kinase RsbW/sigma-B regulation protein RsbU (phosphoserine phosphatase) [Tistlia consotensis USBA 355]SNS23283.1 serine/threonine-protein kinase RsbW [Tistlia consotensis]